MSTALPERYTRTCSTTSEETAVCRLYIDKASLHRVFTTYALADMLTLRDIQSNVSQSHILRGYDTKKEFNVDSKAE